MKTKNSELLHSQTNVNTQDKENSNSHEEKANMSTYNKIKGTPFAVVKDKTGQWLITMGEHIAHIKRFKSKEEAITEIHNKSWDLICNAALILIETTKNI